MPITRSLSRSLTLALLALLALPGSYAAAEEAGSPASQPYDPLADGKLTREELAVAAVAGQQQLVKLTEQAVDEYTAGLGAAATPVPAAWMLLEDGKTIKQLNLDGQAVDAPANVKILMYRAALKSIARRGKIHAAVILYTGKVDADSDTRVLVIEHEHRLGISGNKIVPYQVEAGTVAFGEAVTRDKPFQMFYDDRGDLPASGG